jgi:hypothetical protein
VWRVPETSVARACGTARVRGYHERERQSSPVYVTMANTRRKL